ncbi:MlaD family protein [Spirillospora sp. NPDC048819]|uniref:MlaD family protein n=1 Tax=Spirillospora sp. NPDC048819 TaxID=3155268 RepID=UPI0033E66C32
MINEELSVRRRLQISLVTLLVTAMALYLLVARPFQREGTVLTAEFDRAGQGLGTGAPVKVRGMTVGTVDEVELTGGGRVRLTLRLDEGTRVPDSVTASIEPASAFGPKFVDLVPGAHETGGPYLAPGAHIARTSGPRDLSDLLADANTQLGAVDPGEVFTVVHTLAQGLEGRGRDLRATIDQTGVLVNVAHKNRVNARRFLGDAADLSGALANSGDEIVGIGSDANALIETAAGGGHGRLGAFADQISELSELVSHGFDKRGGQLGEAFRSGERAAAVIYSQLGLLGGSIRTANRLLPRYQELIRHPGPGGKHYLESHLFLPTDPCALIRGMCGPADAGGR